MTPDLNQIYTGNCLDVMKGWPENFVDTIITDPPYGLSFMGKEWDHGVPGAPFWAEALRIAKPGTTLLAFGGTRTYHRLAVAIEDAGWQIRDCLMWLYGSGFPKSLDISKAIDKAAGKADERGYIPTTGGLHGGSGDTVGKFTGRQLSDTPVTPLATQWDGWGTALKPAWEPIIMAMKPCDGTFAQNAELWGVAGINLDGARIGQDVVGWGGGGGGSNSWKESEALQRGGAPRPVIGRFPANVMLDEDAAAILDDQSGAIASTASGYNFEPSPNDNPTHIAHNIKSGIHFGDSGGASRFFYVAKAASSERNEGCEALEDRAVHRYGAGIGYGPTQDLPVIEKNHHPTVKPLDLMKYLVNLTKTPTGGIVLDPFSGSGTTLWAAESHNRPWLGIEMNPEYVQIAQARIALERSQLKLPLEAAV